MIGLLYSTAATKYILATVPNYGDSCGRSGMLNAELHRIVGRAERAGYLAEGRRNNGYTVPPWPPLNPLHEAFEWLK